MKYLKKKIWPATLIKATFLRNQPFYGGNNISCVPCLYITNLFSCQGQPGTRQVVQRNVCN